MIPKVTNRQEIQMSAKGEKYKSKSGMAKHEMGEGMKDRMKEYGSKKGGMKKAAPKKSAKKRGK